jgi:hypothetical protein
MVDQARNHDAEILEAQAYLDSRARLLEELRDKIAEQARVAMGGWIDACGASVVREEPDLTAQLGPRLTLLRSEITELRKKIGEGCAADLIKRGPWWAPKRRDEFEYSLAFTKELEDALAVQFWPIVAKFREYGYLRRLDNSSSSTGRRVHALPFRFQLTKELETLSREYLEVARDGFRAVNTLTYRISDKKRAEAESLWDHAQRG